MRCRRLIIFIKKYFLRLAVFVVLRYTKKGKEAPRLTVFREASFRFLEQRVTTIGVTNSTTSFLPKSQKK